MNDSQANQFAALESLLTGLRRNPRKNDVLTSDAANRLQKLAEESMKVAEDAGADVDTRAICIRVVGCTPQPESSHVKSLVAFLSAENDSKLQLAAIDALAERNQPEVADVLLDAWRTFTPALRASSA